MALGWGQPGFNAAFTGLLNTWTKFWAHLYKYGPAAAVSPVDITEYLESTWPGYSATATPAFPPPAYDYTTPYGNCVLAPVQWTVGAIQGTEPVVAWGVFDTQGRIVAIGDISPALVASTPGQVITLNLSILLIGQQPAGTAAGALGPRGAPGGGVGLDADVTLVPASAADTNSAA